LQGRSVEVLWIALFAVVCSPVEKADIGAFEGAKGLLQLRESPCPD